MWIIDRIVFKTTNFNLLDKSFLKKRKKNNTLKQ